MSYCRMPYDWHEFDHLVCAGVTVGAFGKKGMKQSPIGLGIKEI